MSATTKIDFEPGLFDPGPPESTTIRPKTIRRINRAPLILAGLLFGLAVTAFFVINDITTKPKLARKPGLETTRSGFVPSPPLYQELETTPSHLQDATLAVIRTDKESPGFCVGYEVFCSTSTTDKPAELLNKLTSAMPESNAKRYRVKVSVALADEEGWSHNGE